MATKPRGVGTKGLSGRATEKKICFAASQMPHANLSNIIYFAIEKKHTTSHLFCFRLSWNIFFVVIVASNIYNSWF